MLLHGYLREDRPVLGQPLSVPRQHCLLARRASVLAWEVAAEEQVGHCSTSEAWEEVAEVQNCCLEAEAEAEEAADLLRLEVAKEALKEVQERVVTLLEAEVEEAEASCAHRYQMNFVLVNLEEVEAAESLKAQDYL